MLVLSQYVEERYAAELLSGNRDPEAGVGYLLKDRVGNIAELLNALHRVAGGGSALDPEVVGQLTATNVRLGVWLPHPTLVRAARRRIEQPGGGSADRWWARQPLFLLLWYLLPHLLWGRNADRNSDRETRLWAHVLTRRLHGGLSGTLWYRALQPTLGLLWAEVSGHLSYRGTWMYVTDGGHYDNLGLVEALRRGASHIVVLDASGDKADT